MSPCLERPPAEAGLENNPTLCGKALNPTSHEPPPRVIPLPDLQRCTSSQLRTQLNHPLSGGMADPPPSGMAQPDSSPCAGSVCASTTWHRQAHQCPPLQRSPNPRRSGAAGTQPEALPPPRSALGHSEEPLPACIAGSSTSSCPISRISACPNLYPSGSAGHVPICPCSGAGLGV